MKIIIIGGAGFIGSSLALAFKEQSSSHQLVALDNLKRRGSELNLPIFKELGIEFVHADIRDPADFDEISNREFDLMIEASAEPSVLAGLGGSPTYVLGTNLVGTLNCLEFARKRVQQLVFLSTSRVYSIQPLLQIRLNESDSRFELEAEQNTRGVSTYGISEKFSTERPGSLYGATKLAAELIIREYVSAYEMKAIINRCGVVTGPGQFGKVDQGVFTFWVACHFFKRPLRYTGFGGKGKQVRDLLHPRDLFFLLLRQIERFDDYPGCVFNVGGGKQMSVSLREFTDLCEEVTGNRITIESDPKTTSVDIPYYVSDMRHASKCFAWQPKISLREITEAIFNWVRENEVCLKPIFC